MNLRYILLLAVFLIMLPLSTVYSEINFWSDLPDDKLTDELLASMNDEQKLAQLMLFGYMGGVPSREILDWIENKEIGGVKIFGWNVGSLPQLTKSISKMQQEGQTTKFKIPLFMVTDQEGGWVHHIHKGTTETSGNMSLTASNRPEDSFKAGYYIGTEMRTLGINVNFAPTVDVYSNPNAHVIGPRAFSDDPEVTSLLSIAFFKGMDKTGVICTAKHYPGHGDADKDSHGALPIIKADLDTLWDRDLLPYRYLVKEDLPAIMSGHLAFPSITGDETPASLSDFFLEDLLRDRIGFKGLVITDDIMMNGVQLLPINTAEIAKAAIMAGNDIVLVSRTAKLQKKVWIYLTAELKSDPAFKKRVEESAERVIKTKLKYLKPETAVPLYPDPSIVKNGVPDD
ncbi:MAG: glycoside hydrolase family 3 protein, partial [Spirochaetales bacterium]|nr:glycoside hydrolase family 3 protein [Spirochaetales bacterium]